MSNAAKNSHLNKLKSIILFIILSNLMLYRVIHIYGQLNLRFIVNTVTFYFLYINYCEGSTGFDEQQNYFVFVI